MNQPYRVPDPPEPQLPIYSGGDCECRKCGDKHGATSRYRTTDDIIVRECRRCHFTWCERPLSPGR